MDRTLGCRFELKYLLTEAKAEAIAQYVKLYLSLDRYSKLQPGGFYPIVSLYLDSENLQLCRESLGGLKNRFKLRVRAYSDDHNYPSFFEIKRRITNVILKSRAPVLHRNVEALLSGATYAPQDYKTDERSLNQFQLYMNSIMARPTVLIRYMRQAYEGGTENRVRVTLDRELCYKITSKPEVTLNSSGWQGNSLTLGHVILEVKFTARYPAWLNRMVRHFDLRSRSISKYATSIKQSCALGFCAPKFDGVGYG
ncbi:MAG: polyphosphate polymerase domain-containing protein [Phycisphaerales bacterium]|nr:MAG: polyphosphate polymerase domain-containing protein [Phycisphaerales bacterium]